MLTPTAPSPALPSVTTELPAYKPGVFIDVASPDLALPTRGIRPRRRSRLQRLLIGVSGGTGLLVVGGVLALATLLSPIGARRAGRAAALQELESELADGERVVARAYVSQRNWSDNFRESFGVLAATDRRLVYVGAPPTPWIGRADDGPLELRAQSLPYDIPFGAENRRFLLGTTRGVLVRTATGPINFMVGRGEAAGAQEIEQVVARALAAQSTAMREEEMANRPPPAPAQEYVTHTVRYGEAVTTIARRYQTSPDVIRQLNRLRTDAIRAGQRLRVPAPPDSAAVP